MAHCEQCDQGILLADWPGFPLFTQWATFTTVQGAYQLFQRSEAEPILSSTQHIVSFNDSK